MKTFNTTKEVQEELKRRQRIKEIISTEEHPNAQIDKALKEGFELEEIFEVAINTEDED